MRPEDYVPGEEIEHGCPACGHAISPVDPDDRMGKWQHTDLGVSCVEGDEQDSPVCKIEFLAALEGGTWCTEIFEVPSMLFHDDCTNDDRVEWVMKVHGEKPEFQNVVLWSVYCLSPDGMLG